jgi:hypothetical protein
MTDTSAIHSFSEDAKELIFQVTGPEAHTIDDLIKAQEATDRSHKVHAFIAAWSNQQDHERRLRRLYALCFAVFLGLQILALNALFYFIGMRILTFSDSTIGVFFVSVFGEITALVLIITKHLFPGNGEVALKMLKDL